MIATIGAIILFVVAVTCGLVPVAIFVVCITFIETCCTTGQDDHSWLMPKIHIIGCLLFFTIMWLMALWPEPSDPNLAPWMDPIEPNFPFREFHYEVEQLHGELPIPEVDSAYWWWVLVGIPVVRALIVHPILLACHRKD